MQGKRGVVVWSVRRPTSLVLSTADGQRVALALTPYGGSIQCQARSGPSPSRILLYPGRTVPISTSAGQVWLTCHRENCRLVIAINAPLVVKIDIRREARLRPTG